MKVSAVALFLASALMLAAGFMSGASHHYKPEALDFIAAAVTLIVAGWIWKKE